MTCRCQNCSDTSTDNVVTQKFAHEPATEIKNVHDSLEDVYELLEAGLVVQAQILILKLQKEIDLIDGDLHELQKVYAKRGEGSEARDLGKISQRLI